MNYRLYYYLNIVTHFCHTKIEICQQVWEKSERNSFNYDKKIKFQ